MGLTQVNSEISRADSLFVILWLSTFKAVYAVDMFWVYTLSRFVEK